MKLSLTSSSGSIWILTGGVNFYPFKVGAHVLASLEKSRFPDFHYCSPHKTYPSLPLVMWPSGSRFRSGDVVFSSSSVLVVINTQLGRVGLFQFGIMLVPVLCFTINKVFRKKT